MWKAKEDLPPVLIARVYGRETIDDRLFPPQRPDWAYDEIRRAITNVNLDRLADLLRHYVTEAELAAIVKERDGDGRNLLHLACSTNNVYLLRFILNRCPRGSKQIAILQEDLEGKSPLLLSLELGNNIMFSSMSDVVIGQIANFLTRLIVFESHSLLQVAVKDDQVYQLMKDQIAPKFVASHTAITAEQIRMLEPYCKHYIIPSEGETSPHALICHNGQQENAAGTLSQAFRDINFDSNILNWTSLHGLCKAIGENLTASARQSSVIFIALLCCDLENNPFLSFYGGLQTILDEVGATLKRDGRDHIPVVILIQSDQQSGGDGDKVILQRPHTLILRANTTSRQDYNLDYVTALAAQLRAANGRADIHAMHTEALQHLRGEQLPVLPGQSTLMHHLILPANIQQGMR